MKKILSLALASVLALGMTVTAFAAGPQAISTVSASAVANVAATVGETVTTVTVTGAAALDPVAASAQLSNLKLKDDSGDVTGKFTITQAAAAGATIVYTVKAKIVGAYTNLVATYTPDGTVITGVATDDAVGTFTVAESLPSAVNGTTFASVSATGVAGTEFLLATIPATSLTWNGTEPASISAAAASLAKFQVVSVSGLPAGYTTRVAGASIYATVPANTVAKTLVGDLVVRATAFVGPNNSLTAQYTAEVAATTGTTPEVPGTPGTTIITDGKINGWNTSTFSTSTGKVDAFSRYYIGQPIDFVINSDNFTWVNGRADTYLTANKLRTSTISLVLGGSKKSNFTASIVDNADGRAVVRLVPQAEGQFADGTVTFNLTAGNIIGNNSTLSVWSIGLINVFQGETSNTKITSQVKNLGTYYTSVNSGNQKNPLDLKMFAGDKVKLPMTSSMFGLTDVVVNSPVTQNMIRNGKVEVRTAISEGSKWIKSVTIQYENFSALNTAIGSVKTAFVEVKMIKPFVSVEEKDVKFDVYLVIGDTRTEYKEFGQRLEGVMTFNITPVYANDTYVDLSLGQVAECMEYAKNVEVDLGNGISIMTKMFKGKKYYGIAEAEADEADLVVFAQYPDVDRVFSLKTVGLNSTGDVVKMNLTGDVYFVYNTDMKFVGMSNEMLVYSTKYYVANKKLNVADADETEVVETEPTDTVNPPTGGSNAPSNANNNPSTGC